MFLNYIQQPTLSTRRTDMVLSHIPYGVYWSTPFAKWQGSLANMNSVRLAAQVGRGVLEAKKVPLERIDLGILGITNPQKGSFYGLPWLSGMLGAGHVAGPTVQQACATSVRSLQMATQEIQGGTARCALLVMCDRMSNGPLVHYPDTTAPGGYGITERWTLDNFAADPNTGLAMLETGENVARRFGITLEEQHALKLHRYQQYQAALADDRAFQRRYMVDAPIFDSAFRKQTGTLSADEGVFPTTAEGLARLKPVKEGGTITFGAQTHPADGNAGALVTTRELARELTTDPGIEVQVLGFGQSRVEKAHMPMAPAPAAMNALAHAGLTLADVDAIKTHNPFAVNDLAFARETGFAWERMNNYGSSVVWGHPQGPTGLRAVIELIEELVLRGGGVGLFTGCAAGDTGLATVIRVTDARAR
jgi:acetyl-CoA acetyltransferase family protein